MKSGLLDNVHAELVEINGVGTKIASFFLRDIVLQYSILPEFNRFLCFPVDRWVRRASESLWPELADRDDLFMANDVVTHCLAARVSPELVNAGMWYLGARITSETGDSDLVERPGDWETAIKSYAALIRTMADAWDEFEATRG